MAENFYLETLRDRPRSIHLSLLIEVKMITKMKKHNLFSNWQIVFISDTDKQTLTDIYEILIIKNLKEFRQIF